MGDINVSIRNLQHFMYCPHRWGLINIDCSWAENYFVTKGNLIHERVHDPDKAYHGRDKQVLTSVPVYKDDIGIYGVTDCIELRESKRGIGIPGYQENLMRMMLFRYLRRSCAWTIFFTVIPKALFIMRMSGSVSACRLKKNMMTIWKK